MTDVDRTAAPTSVSALARKVVSFELGVWRSLYRWATRRPRGPAGAETFGYAGPATPVIWAFIGLSAVEIPVAHLLLPWQTARVVVLLVGVWGLTWMFGLLASLKTYPHVVGGSGLRLRYGTSIDITIPWEAVESIGVRHRDLPSSRTVQISGADSGTVVHVGISSQTNVDVTLRDPVTVPLPKGTESITALRFYADDARSLVASARQHLTPHR